MANLTRNQIHSIGVTHLMKRLELCGMKRLPDNLEIVGDMPEWSFQHMPRRRIDADNRLMPRDLLIRCDGDEASLKVYATRTGQVLSSLYRSVAYMAFSDEQLIQILIEFDEAEISRWMKWVSMTQSAVIKTTNLGGIRTAAELLTVICKARRLPVEKANQRFEIDVEEMLRDHKQLVLPFNKPNTTKGASK